MNCDVLSKDLYSRTKRKADVSLANPQKKRISETALKRMRLQEEVEQLDAQLQQIDEQISRGKLPSIPNPSSQGKSETESKRKLAQARSKRMTRPLRSEGSISAVEPFPYSAAAPLVSTRRRPKVVKKPVLPAPTWKRIRPLPSVSQFIDKNIEPLVYCRHLLRVVICLLSRIYL
eukprot:TRINITY_DN3073_c0_g1_i78.p1 TRINITY_DN3073_c0_g1~~TRINITY_DN3073_c0_g1_i78.p1  ORF type:complete len:175 (+),score=23.00 TRINITY_DN3073_c0_g1_i78:136-660(+)